MWPSLVAVVAANAAGFRWPLFLVPVLVFRCNELALEFEYQALECLKHMKHLCS